MRKTRKEQFSFRFRRWSRKSYAVFSGLKRTISIGTLRFDMLEQLSRKSNSLILWCDFFALPDSFGEQEQVAEWFGEELTTRLLFCSLQAEEGGNRTFIYTAIGR